MTTQAENAIARYRQNLEKELAAASNEVRSAAIQDAEEFLVDEIQAMDVGRLTSEDAAYNRFVERFGTPKQLAANYLEQCEGAMPLTVLPEKSVYASTGSWKKLAASLLLAVIATGGICYAALSEPPKLSPFTDVKFQGEELLVTYEGNDYEWLELDDLTVMQIVASSKEQFGDLWQKRVAEDLVEVLWGMDHRPSDTVRLRLVDPITKAENVVAAAPMTKENRRSLYQNRTDAAKANAAEPPATP